MRAAVFPYDALARFAGCGEWVATIDLAAAVGVEIRTMWRWRSAGYLTELQADRAAIALGVHPTAIWPDWPATP